MHTVSGKYYKETKEALWTLQTLENIGFLRMMMLSKQPLYGQVLVELKENWNDCKILLGGDIGFKLSQILSNDVAKTFR